MNWTALFAIVQTVGTAPAMMSHHTEWPATPANIPVNLEPYSSSETPPAIRRLNLESEMKVAQSKDKFGGSNGGTKTVA